MADSADLFISGGGIAGLIAAAAFADHGFSVILADPTPPPQSAEADESDLRSTAYLRPACDLLQEIGLWEALYPAATPLETLQVIDTTGQPPHPRATRSFRSSDLGEAAFGWNLPNWLTRKLLAEKLAQNAKVDLRFKTGFQDILTRRNEAIVTLTDGARIRCKLAIAADGRASPLRDALGISVETKRYGQKALAFVVTHPLPHNNTSIEIYNSGGAFTLVPLADHDGTPASAVVWMNDGPRANELMGMDTDVFSQAATERSTGVLGALSLASPRRSWPVVTQRATVLAGERVAILAEAAHVLPPIGAQGLNTSLHDVSSLLALAKASPDQLGSDAMLAQFAKARGRDIHARAQVIDLFNRVCKSDKPALQALRTLGLKLTHDIRPVRTGIMRAGLGT